MRTAVKPTIRAGTISSLKVRTKMITSGISFLLLLVLLFGNY
jgi:hypothetical protein